MITTTFKGIELVLEEPNRIDDLDKTLVTNLVRLDYSVGVFNADIQMLAPRVKWVFSWLLDGRPAIKAFKDWEANKRGKLKPFWVPTWRKDLLVVGKCTSDYMPVANIAYDKMYGMNPSRKHLIFFKQDGSYLIKTITSVTTDDVMQYIHVTPSWDADYYASDFKLISFLSLYRIDTDLIEYQWETPTVVTVKTPLIEVPLEVPS